VFAIWIPVCVNFFTKIPKNYSMFLKYCFIILWYCYMLKLMKKCMCIYFTYSCISVFFWWVSCIIVDLNSCHIMLIGTWLYDFIPPDSMMIHLILARLILFRFCAIVSTLLKLEFCDISHILVKIDYNFVTFLFLTLLKVIFDYNGVTFCNLA